MCVMASRCKQVSGESARVLGDAAGELLGPDTNLVRVWELLAGAPPATPDEAVLAEHLIDADRALGFVDVSAGRIA